MIPIREGVSVTIKPQYTFTDGSVRFYRVSIDAILTPEELDQMNGAFKNMKVMK